jgi:hypothetical protein
MVNGQEAWRVGLTLSSDDGALNVTRGGETLATLDTETFALSEPGAPAPPAATDESGGPSGVAIGLLAVGIALVGGTILGLRRRRRAVLPTDPFGPGHPAVEEPADEPDRERVSS